MSFLPQRLPRQLHQPPQKTEAPNLFQLFGMWARIGSQSFGGGATTLLLMRRTFTINANWLSADEFTRFMALSNLAPGINITALTILIGRKMGGFPGILVSLLGLYLPSALITTLLTASYVAIKDWRPMQTMMRGIIPAVSGLYLVVLIQYALPQLRQSYKMGYGAFSRALLFITVAAVMLGVLQLSSSLVLVAGAIGGAFLLAPRTARALPAPGSDITPIEEPQL